jgi:hypothetical protein
MHSSTSASRFAALLLGLAIFAGAERAIWTSPDLARFLLRHQTAAASGDTFAVAARIQLIKSGAFPPLVLLGSSLVREGLDCDILNMASWAADCVNLGIGGGAPLDMLYISRELSAGPRTVVIGLFPGVIAKGPKSGFIDFQTVHALADSGALSEASPDDWRLLGSGLLQNLSPTLRHREGLRAAFDEATGDPSERIEEGLPSGRRTSDHDRKPPEYFANRIGSIDRDFALSRFTPAQDLALEWLIKREVEASHRVVVVDFPSRPGFETILPPDVLAHYAAQLASLRARTDILFIEASRLGPLSEDDFIDFTHVDSNGRRLVSGRLREILRP